MSAVIKKPDSSQPTIPCADKQTDKPVLSFCRILSLTTVPAHLLVQDFSEWAQCQVLDFVSRYRPADADEVYDIMNALDDRLATPNSAVVLATVRVFLNMTLSMPYDHQQVGRHNSWGSIFSRPAMSVLLLPSHSHVGKGFAGWLTRYRLWSRVTLVASTSSCGIIHMRRGLATYTVCAQVLERIKDPLMTLVSRDHHETAYAVLAHFLIIAQRAPLIFASVRLWTHSQIFADECAPPA